MENTKLPSERSFGIVFAILFFLISIYPLIYSGEIKYWYLMLSVLFLILGILNSKLLTPLNKIWFKFGIFLGKIVSPFIMVIIFFLVVTPIGILMRLMRKDLLNLKFDSSSSYWIKKDGIKSKMKNQF